MPSKTWALWGLASALLLCGIARAAQLPEETIEQEQRALAVMLKEIGANSMLLGEPAVAPPRSFTLDRTGVLKPAENVGPDSNPVTARQDRNPVPPSPTSESGGEPWFCEFVAPASIDASLLIPRFGCVLASPVAAQLPRLPEPESLERVVVPLPSAAPLGFAGVSRIGSIDVRVDDNAVPTPDRWRIGFPDWDRYGNGHPPVDDYPYVPGNWWDPFNQNVLKGDYPIYGQHLFLEITASTQITTEGRQVPTAATSFESTANPGQRDLFGSPNQFSYFQNFFLSFDLFHGDASFKPVDWRIKLTPAFNINYLAVDELGVVSPNVNAGTTRGRTFATLEEWFGEVKLFDVGSDYDFVSVRAGAQPFTSDFRGFIFSDVNRGIRLFGNAFSNQDQYNLVYFNMLEKDTDSLLNTFKNREQQVVIANFYRQDFIFPGYTAQWSFHYNHDSPTTLFDTNGFLVRPDPVGTFQPHTIDVCYLGWAGDGHIGDLNITHAFYWALGHDSMNPLANSPQVINAQMFAIELSKDFDWLRFRTSFFWASGDQDINNHTATGFDTIDDNPNFAGGEFSYWQRQQLQLFGVNLVQRFSLVPDLRSSKFQGQENFVNPGLYLGNFGIDAELTPKLRLVNNANVMWFDSVNTLQQFLYQDHINHFIGVDLSSGLEYRPLLNNNVIIKAGLAALLPGQGFQDLFASFDHGARVLFAGFVEATLTY